MLDDIKFKNKENKETYILLRKLMDLKEEAKCGKTAAKIRYERHFAFLCDKFAYIPQIHVKRYMRFSNYEDLLQEGNLGLIIALEKFDMTRSNNFYRLANMYVKTRVKRAANKYDVINVPMEIAKDNPPIRVSFGASDWSPMGHADTDPLQEFESMERSRKIKETILELPSDHKKVVCMYYGIKVIKGDFVMSSSKKKNISFISDKVGMSRAKVKKVIDNTNTKINQL
ncbi:MAG TPA: sigma-70 family RNA polymerase sigma factor [Candidatus Glassbacteria bacterium]|nr:sigma-70 family RNA polymerase sigma factor [Candidatus Glassbacteria bacterium]